MCFKAIWTWLRNTPLVQKNKGLLSRCETNSLSKEHTDSIEGKKGSQEKSMLFLIQVVKKE